MSNQTLDTSPYVLDEERSSMITLIIKNAMLYTKGWGDSYRHGRHHQFATAVRHLSTAMYYVVGKERLQPFVV